MPRCVAFKCNENGNHRFPQDSKLRTLWEKATRLKFFKATANSRLCSKHFKKSDFLINSSPSGRLWASKNLVRGVIPSVFSWTKQSNLVSERSIRYLQRSARKLQFIPDETQFVQNQYMKQDTETIAPPCSCQFPAAHNVPDFESEVEIESDIIIEYPSVSVTATSSMIRNKFTQTPHLNRLFSMEELIIDETAVKFYTGLDNYERFQLVLSTLMPMANHIHYRGSQVLNLSIEDQFLMILIKLRRNSCDYELSKIFDVSTTEVGNIIITWINFIHQMWSKLDIWPSRELVDYYMPPQFKKHHKSTRVIVDGTEVPIMRPKNPKSQQATFSAYKHHNTIKFLVGSTPGGLLSFCSEAYAGSTSDRQLTERGCLLEKCEPNDSIMADRGFNVQDLFAHKDIKIMIPNFLKGVTQLPGIKLQHDRKLAANRIHIERLIGLTKTYKILKTDFNSYYVPLASKIFFICIMLCNFRNTIVQ